MEKLKKQIGIEEEVPELSLVDPVVHKKSEVYEEIKKFCERIKNAY